MRVAVTGAAGFIGTHACRGLLLAGHDIVAIDSFSAFHPRELKERRWAELVGTRSERPLEVSVADRDAIFSVFETISIDSVVHLAAQAGVRYSNEHPEMCVESNVLGTYNVLSAAAEFGVANVIYASSSSVYGDTDRACREEDLHLTPSSLYGATKLSGEILARAQFEASGLSSIGVRFFTVYGEWGRPDMAYFHLLYSALTGHEFPLYSDLSVERDLTYVSDAVDILVALVEGAAPTYSGARVVNAGGGTPHSLAHLVETIEDVTGRRVNVRRSSSTPGDIGRTEASTELLRQLGLPVPGTPLRVGIERTADWMTSCVDAARRWID